MDLENYAPLLGKLQTNLHSLELSLRSFLHNRFIAESGRNPDWLGEVGQEVETTPFTDWRTLGDLIESYNSVIANSGKGGMIDRSITHLRDAIAHGRVLLHDGADDLRLVKYGKPRGGKARVEFNQLLTEEWLKSQIRVVADALFAVNKQAQTSGD